MLKQHDGLITKEEIRAFYDEIAPDLEDYRRKNAYYHERVEALLLSIIPPRQRVLDIGCGLGTTLHRLQPAFGMGVDLSPRTIVRAKQLYPELIFTVGDCENLDVGNGPFDFVLLCNTVGYVQDIQKALRSIHGVCTPATRFVLVHYNYLWEPLLKLAEKCNLKMPEPYQNWLSVDDLANLLRLESFEVIRTRQEILLPKRVPLLSSFLNRYCSRLPVLRGLALMEVLVARTMPAATNTRMMSCSVIVPARNERGNIDALVRQIPMMGSHTELIFVEGHSNDGTYEEIQKVAAANPYLDIKLVRQDGEGKGDAVRKGFDHANGDVLMILDADMTVHPHELRKFYQSVSSGTSELAIGCRLVYPRQKESMRFLNLIANKVFSVAFTFLLEQRIKDTLCGTKALLRKNYMILRENRTYFGCLDPFGDFDLIFGAAKANLKITEIPVRYQARTYGETQIKRFRHGMLLLRMVLIAFRKLKFRT